MKPLSIQTSKEQALLGQQLLIKASTKHEGNAA